MNISTSKPRYACVLVGFHFYNDNPNNIVAVIKRLDHHVKLDAPNAKITVTSLIIRIDAQQKLIETLNSVYCYGG